MLKLVQPRLVRIGKVVIGERGGKGGAPIKFDHFVVKTLYRGIDGKLVTDHRMMERIGEQPTSLRIRLPYNDIDLAFQTNLRYYRGSRLFCVGDGEEAQRLTVINGGERTTLVGPPTWGERLTYGPAEPYGPCGTACKDFQARRCKPLGILSFVLEDQQQIGGCYQWRTTSWNSIGNVLSGLAKIKADTGGIIAWVPLTMRLVPQTVQPQDGSPPNTAYIVQIVYDGSPQHLLETVRDLMSLRLPLMQEIRELEAGLKALPPFDEESEESDDTQHEFYPEMAEAGPPSEEEPPLSTATMTPIPPPPTMEETAASTPSPAPLPAPPTVAPSPPRRRSRAEMLSTASRLIRALAPGDTATAKQDRKDIIRSCWAKENWLEVESLPMSKIREGLTKLEAMTPETPPPAARENDVDVPDTDVPVSLDDQEGTSAASGETISDTPISVPSSEGDRVTTGDTGTMVAIYREPPTLGSDGLVAWGDIEILRAWADHHEQSNLFGLLTRGLPSVEGRLVMTQTQFEAIREAILLAVKMLHPDAGDRA